MASIRTEARKLLRSQGMKADAKAVNEAVKLLTPQPVSGSNAGVPVYQSGQQGIGYNEAVSLLRQHGIGKDQTYMDPDSVAATVSDLGYTPNFGDPTRIQRRNTPGDPLYVDPQIRSGILGIPVGQLGVSENQRPASQQNTTQFNTGNTELDDFLNNTYLPIIEAEFYNYGDPSAVLDPKIFQQISDRVEKTYGPIFKRELDIAQQQYDLQKSTLDLSQEKQSRALRVSSEKETSALDLKAKREEEDKLRALANNAFSFDEHKTNLQESIRKRGLTFSGIRQKKESDLELERQKKTSEIELLAERSRRDIDEARKRSLEELKAQQDFLTRSGGLQQQGLGSELEKEKQRIAGERVIQEAEERKRLRDLGTTLISNPNF